MKGLHLISLISLASFCTACVYPPLPVAPNKKTSPQQADSSSSPSSEIQENLNTPDNTVVFQQEGRCSYYGKHFHGKSTASGEAYTNHDLTAAHRTLAFGTKVRVTNLRNGKSVVVRINDRGPFSPGRVIDISHSAAAQLGMLDHGVVRVRVEALCDGDECQNGLALNTAEAPL